MNVDDGSYKQMLNLKTIYHGSFQEEATIFYVILRKRHCTIQNSLVAKTYSRTSVLRYTTNRCTKYGHEKIHMLVEAETSGKNVRNDLGCNIQLNEIVVKKVTLRRNPSF